MDHANLVTLKGFLGADPVITPLTSRPNASVANVRLATNRPDWRDEQGNWHKREPRWVSVSVFLPSAIEFFQTAKKGDGVELRCSVEDRKGEMKLICDQHFEGHLAKSWNPRGE